MFGHGVLENLIQALSRTFRHRFKDFQGPCLFSRTLQALKIWKKIKDFQGPSDTDSRTFKDHVCFQGLYRPWKSRKNSRTFKDPQEPWQYLNVTDGQTDRQTDRQKDRWQAIAPHGKNQTNFWWSVKGRSPLLLEVGPFNTTRGSGGAL